MEKLKHVFYDKENDLWYIIPIKDEFLTNKKELVYEKKELIFIGDKPTEDYDEDDYNEFWDEETPTELKDKKDNK